MRFSVGGTVAAWVILLVSTASSADERAPLAGRFALDLSGVRYGFVRAIEPVEKGAGPQQLVLATSDIAPSLGALVDTYAQGKAVKRDVRLTSGAVMRKANDARLVSVKLPALGAGGGTDVELAFVAPSITTQPLLSAKEAPPPPASARITGFRVGISGMDAIEAPKLDAITLAQKADGSVATGDLAIEVGAGGAPPFVAWQKKPAPRAMHVEYTSTDGTALLKLNLERCVPAAVKPLGANGTTRITLSCASLRSGS